MPVSDDGKQPSWQLFLGFLGLIGQAKVFNNQQCQFRTRNKCLKNENKSNCSMFSECVCTDLILPRGCRPQAWLMSRFQFLAFSSNCLASIVLILGPILLYGFFFILELTRTARSNGGIAMAEVAVLTAEVAVLTAVTVSESLFSGESDGRKLSFSEG